MKKLNYLKIKEDLKKQAKERDIKLEQVTEIYKLNLKLKRLIEGANIITKEKMLKDVTPVNNGKCLFYPENEAYLRFNKSGVYEYVSVNKSAELYFTLNLITMIEVVLNKGYYDAQLFALRATMIETEEEDWIKSQEDIYSQNEKIIKELFKEDDYFLSRAYAELVRTAKESLSCGWNKSYLFNNKCIPYFSISNSYLGHRIGKSKITATRMILYMIAVGILCYPFQLPERYESYPTKFGNKIGVYILPIITEAKINQIKKRIDFLNSININRYNISKKQMEGLI